MLEWITGTALRPVKSRLTERGSGSSSGRQLIPLLDARLPGAAGRQDVLPVPPDLRCGSGRLERRLLSSSMTCADELVDVGAGGVEHQIGVLGRLVGRVDAGEALEFARAGPRVQALGIAPLALLERVDTYTSMNGSFAASLRARAISRSDFSGDTSDANATTPASANSRVRWPTRRMFSARSPAEKPRSSDRPCRMLSPSSR